MDIIKPPLDNEFKEGDTVVVRETFYPHLTKGEEYTVIKYEPKTYEPNAGYTWPAYVTVQKGDKRNTYHADRFIKKGDNMLVSIEFKPEVAILLCNLVMNTTYENWHTKCAEPRFEATDYEIEATAKYLRRVGDRRDALLDHIAKVLSEAVAEALVRTHALRNTERAS